MRHFLLIDPLEKLGIKKDSSLMLSLTLKEKGHETYLLFLEDFYITNGDSPPEYEVHDFEGSFAPGSFYLNDFSLTQKKRISLRKGDTLHMRLDPPFDTKYLRTLWMLESLEAYGIRVVNNPRGILLFNEKLCAYENSLEKIPSFIGSNASQLKVYLKKWEVLGYTELIFKPMDLYQGMGVERVDAKALGEEQLGQVLARKVRESNGPVIVQPFLKEVLGGEVRSLYFKGQELGSILKTPAQGEFLANIARGASYRVHSLNERQKKSCEAICQKLQKFGIDWIAFDILGNRVSEVNLTCPGLLVEVSNALQKNLAERIIELMK